MLSQDRRTVAFEKRRPQPEADLLSGGMCINAMLTGGRVLACFVARRGWRDYLRSANGLLHRPSGLRALDLDMDTSDERHVLMCISSRNSPPSCIETDILNYCCLLRGWVCRVLKEMQVPERVLRCRDGFRAEQLAVKWLMEECRTCVMLPQA